MNEKIKRLIMALVIATCSFIGIFLSHRFFQDTEKKSLIIAGVIFVIAFIGVLLWFYASDIEKKAKNKIESDTESNL
jgi:drug/metabolite transporter (DMT)-like permease